MSWWVRGREGERKGGRERRREREKDREREREKEVGREGGRECLSERGVRACVSWCTKGDKGVCGERESAFGEVGRECMYVVKV